MADDSGSRIGAGAIITVIALVLLVVFMVQNTDETTLTFLAWDFTWPLWLVTLLSSVVGALAWLGLGVIRRHRS